MRRVLHILQLNIELKKLFSSFLLKEGCFSAPFYNNNEQNLILDISETFLLPGFLLKSCEFSRRNHTLVSQLKYQRKRMSLRYIQAIQDLKKIGQAFKENDIKGVVLKGMALNLNGTYDNGIRFSRDIDILVDKDNISRAYKVLKMLGFKYVNPKTRDSVEIQKQAVLPAMSNKEGTLIELHWRATSPQKFNQCPISHSVREIDNVQTWYGGILIPKLRVILPHIIHHAVEDHRMNFGPVFLFDLSVMFKKSSNSWIFCNQLMSELGLLDYFYTVKTPLEEISNHSFFSEQASRIIELLLSDFNWPLIDKYGQNQSFKRVHAYSVKKKYVNTSLLNLLKMKFREISTTYQLPYTSARFWFL